LANKSTDDNSSSTSPGSGSGSNGIAAQSTLALELPLVFVGAVLLGGALGYFLDKAMHTGPWLMFVFGGLGFFGGIREVIRRTAVKK
jgi:F0F1-type ATP synthase assembly protein I